MGGVAVAMPSWFRAQMTRLMGLRFAPTDLTTHWEALHDVPEALLAAAVAQAQREADAFPSPKELLGYADQRRAQVLPLPAEVDRGIALAAPVTLGTLPTGAPVVAVRFWRYYCDRCSDSGWVTHWCGEVTASHQPWLEAARCDRDRAHDAHAWVTPCDCGPTNPAVHRRIETQVRMATARVREGRP
jgi:hypothetical protein